MYTLRGKALYTKQFGWMQFGSVLSGFNASATGRIISRFGLVYRGLMPQQQAGSYESGEMIMMK